MSEDRQQYDVLIIGGGPIGLACGLEAKAAGLNYAILEKGPLVNSLYNYPSNMTFFSTSERLEIGGVPFVSNNPKPTRAEALEYYRRIAMSNQLNIKLFEEVQDVQRQEGVYRVRTSKGSYDAVHVIVATGFYDIPNKLNIEGEDLPKVRHYYKDPHFYAGQKVIVVGANNSAVDAALETFRKGAEVTMVIRGPEIGKRVKYWVKPDIENRIKDGEVKAYFNSTLREIRETEADILMPDGLITVKNDFVLSMTGYQPNFDFLRKIGIQLSDDEKLYPAYVPESMESNMPNLYLAGVVCGGMDTHIWFIENSREHASIIIGKILEKQAAA
ncbi:thioredoxin reductase (NADPH) [Anseongella ginsenosidimutans]|uniref:Thioredoxin reductase (NADPH) n=1 Tax=Anseongella ginsenosidimutans TaxID=496056 RepID=A0A4R3KUR2_9SPHI|nr:YpdA family putative bacillithiol disulfide reductase [Anseongella ginsenosidimutans]QEC51546.1 YpdA family putative bacillithiol disulfide reductase [Anseongella ginsenosidimutans]TCS88868.1 thioredoxin reductase (NADPH) [Anseongella ginsenosidimutans]